MPSARGFRDRRRTDDIGGRDSWPGRWKSEVAGDARPVDEGVRGQDRRRVRPRFRPVQG